MKVGEVTKKVKKVVLKLLLEDIQTIKLQLERLQYLADCRRGKRGEGCSFPAAPKIRSWPFFVTPCLSLYLAGGHILVFVYFMSQGNYLFGFTLPV